MSKTTTASPRNPQRVTFRLKYRDLKRDAEDQMQSYLHESPAHAKYKDLLHYKISMPPGSYEFSTQCIEMQDGIMSATSGKSCPITVLDEDA